MQGQFPFKQWVYGQKWTTPCLDRVNRKLAGGDGGVSAPTQKPIYWRMFQRTILNATP